MRGWARARAKAQAAAAGPGAAKQGGGAGGTATSSAGARAGAGGAAQKLQHLPPRLWAPHELQPAAVRVLVPASELGDEGSAAVAALRRRLRGQVPRRGRRALGGEPLRSPRRSPLEATLPLPDFAVSDETAMLLLERRNDGYKSPGGKARHDGDVLKYALALAARAALVLLLRNCPQPAAHEPSCRRWSCTTPLVDNVLGHWPSPRDNLDAAARKIAYGAHSPWPSARMIAS